MAFLAAAVLLAQPQLEPCEVLRAEAGPPPWEAPLWEAPLREAPLLGQLLFEEGPLPSEETQPEQQPPLPLEETLPLPEQQPPLPSEEEEEEEEEEEVLPLSPSSRTSLDALLVSLRPRSSPCSSTSR